MRFPLRSSLFTPGGVKSIPEQFWSNLSLPRPSILFDSRRPVTGCDPFTSRFFSLLTGAFLKRFDNRGEPRYGRVESFRFEGRLESVPFRPSFSTFLHQVGHDVLGRLDLPTSGEDLVPLPRKLSPSFARGKDLVLGFVSPCSPKI